MTRVNLACGDDRRPGWLNVDQYTPADQQMDVRNLQFVDSSIDEVLISHALEHMTETEVPQVLSEARRVLKPNGRMLINVPDLPWVLENWLNVPEDLKWGWPLATVFGLQDNPGEFHRTGFTQQRLTSLLLAAGFADVRVKRFFSHGQGCLWAEAAPVALAPQPRISVLWSPQTAEEVHATLPQLVSLFPADAELVITERWGTASELLGNIMGDVTWLRNTDPITEEAGIAQGAMIARSESVVVLRSGELVSMENVQSRSSLAKRIPPFGFVAGHPGQEIPEAVVIDPTGPMELNGPPAGAVLLPSASRGGLAVVMNTRNEAGKIGNALASVQGVDELIVGDMESTDTTVTIAQSAGAQILALPNAGFCEPGRQAIIDASSCEWVLVLDGDERLSAGGVDALRAIIANAPAHVDCFSLAFRTYVGQTELRSTGWDAHFEWHQRLFRRGAVSWPATVHAVPITSGETQKIDPTVVWVDHDAFDDVAHAMDKFNRYSSAEAKDLVESSSIRPSIVGGLADGIGEFVRRYNPDVDGAASFVMSFGLLAYKFWNHAKALEAIGWDDALVPGSESVKQAWIAFLTKLGEEEMSRLRAVVRSHPAQERIAELTVLNDNYGPNPDCLVDMAGGYAELGQTEPALTACRSALALSPGHVSAVEMLATIEGRFAAPRF